ncbi:MAG: DNA-binding protein [Alphaproteobacteria bacterium]|nr:DNA-binding protein [Alphaproteobacteria bacterium]
MPKRVQIPKLASTADLRNEFWRAPDQALLNRQTTAVGLGYTVGWLEWAATSGGGPVLTKIGRSVRYRKADVLAWLQANSRRISSTAELADKV